MNGSLHRKVILLGTLAVVAFFVYKHDIAAYWKSLSGLQQTMVFAVVFTIALLGLAGFALRSGTGKKQS